MPLAGGLPCPISRVPHHLRQPTKLGPRIRHALPVEWRCSHTIWPMRPQCSPRSPNWRALFGPTPRDLRPKRGYVVFIPYPASFTGQLAGPGGHAWQFGKMGSPQTAARGLDHIQRLNVLTRASLEGVPDQKKILERIRERIAALQRIIQGLLARLAPRKGATASETLTLPPPRP